MLVTLISFNNLNIYSPCTLLLVTHKQESPNYPLKKKKPRLEGVL